MCWTGEVDYYASKWVKDPKKEIKHTDVGEGFRGGCMWRDEPHESEARVKKVFWCLKRIPRVFFHTVAYYTGLWSNLLWQRGCVIGTLRFLVMAEICRAMQQFFPQKKKSSMITWKLWVKKLWFFPSFCSQRRINTELQVRNPKSCFKYGQRKKQQQWLHTITLISAKREKRRPWWENNPLKRVSKHLWKQIVVIHL